MPFACHTLLLVIILMHLHDESYRLLECSLTNVKVNVQCYNTKKVAIMIVTNNKIIY